ncbi:NACHT domain-containing protein [Nocardia asteroides]|uniref:NACHT domain-containing protein n=1 Tax=Nocardia asteroides TaxID=1824 RepID=UPI0033FD8B85
MTDVRLHEIRAYEGSQARAWEELAYQIRPPVGPGHIETRKTRAPDGGVEWYELYEDGHHEGFQAKFNDSLKDALGGMRESVRAVAAKRPEMTHLTFIVPYDFTDGASPSSKSDQDRWTDAVEGWKKGVDGADRLTFGVIRAGDVLDVLSLPKHAGRRAFWFGRLELTSDWLTARWNEARSVAGDRYTPQADTMSDIQIAIDAVCAARPFLRQVDAAIKAALVAFRHDRGAWGENREMIEDRLATLETIHKGVQQSAFDIDFTVIANISAELVALAQEQRRASADYEWRSLDHAVSAALALETFARDQPAALYQRRMVAIEGRSGQGKTHTLLRATKQMIDGGVPAIVIMGQRVKDANWWPAFSGVLGGLPGTSDEFLQALDSLAEASSCRAVIVVDALNEAQRPRMWRDELSALVAQLKPFSHISLIVSYRTDYRDVIAPPLDLPTATHPGLAGHESEALAAYCSLFGISVPVHASLDSSFANPLFLRMYCTVAAGGLGDDSALPTRSSLFTRFAEMQSRRVHDHLQLPPTSAAATKALALMADRLLANGGQSVLRSEVEPQIDAILPGRAWPDTLFHRLISEGLLEVRPDYDGAESVSFPFQAYSEQMLAARLLELTTAADVPRAIAKRLGDQDWLWSPMSLLLPEAYDVELIDLLPDRADDFLMVESMRESLVGRKQGSFGARALDLLGGGLALDGADWVDTVLTLASQVGHPANSDWLHQVLSAQTMADRDATWSIDAFQTEDRSAAFVRLAAWADAHAPAATPEQVRLVAVAFMWLLTSPNRFLRDRASKSLVSLLVRYLVVAEPLIAAARDVDDPYVQERVLTCVYGAVMVGGDNDHQAVALVVNALKRWLDEGLPIHVLARDSARGTIAWAHSRGVANDDLLEQFSPPYGAGAPDEPPTANELEERYGATWSDNGEIVDWRAGAILLSCLDWLGDFNKYVVKSDVGFFSRYPLSGPPPRQDDRGPDSEIEADWAGRWIAHRALALGWTPERFADFESSHDLRRGRDGHKAERFGKKYQWIAHHELLARLADNFHPAHETWNPDPMIYQGPWPWYGRDFDPSLPPSVRSGESAICKVEGSEGEEWASLPSPSMDRLLLAEEWVKDVSDFPTPATMFAPTDSMGNGWIALQRYSTWDRRNAQRRGITKRELDVFFLQFSWLVPRGQGRTVYDYLVDRGLAGREMPDWKRTHTQYLGEQNWAPIVSTGSSTVDDHEIPAGLRDLGLQVRPAVEQYVWEGSTLDCSLDESVNFYTPTAELLGDARWVGHHAEWQVGNTVVAKALRIDDAENGQDILLADPTWLEGRLRELGVELVIGTLSEKHALLDEDDDRNMAFSDVWYVARMCPAETLDAVGPLIKVR